MQIKHVSDPSVFKATNDAEEIKLNYSDRFPYMATHIRPSFKHIFYISSIFFSLFIRAKLFLSSVYYPQIIFVTFPQVKLINLNVCTTSVTEGEVWPVKLV